MVSPALGKSIRLLAGLLVLGLLPSACLKKEYPAAPVVDDVEIENAEVVDPDELLSGLSTAASPRFLGIWDGVVFEYEIFDEALLARDLERIQRYYRARGYYEARVTAARVWKVDEHHVRVAIRVHEGSPVLTRQVLRKGIETLPIEDVTAAVRATELEPGKPFDEADFEATKEGIARALADRGYAFVKVEGKAYVDIARHSAVAEFQVEPGPIARYGEIRIVGLEAIPEGPVRANLDIRAGEKYSRAELEDARTALINLGVFATVEIRQDRSHQESAVVPISVVVQESALRTLRIGGGTRFDVLEWSSHVTLGWEHRNFLGGMRKFSIEMKPGLAFFPTRMDNFVAPTDLLPKYRARLELRQPAFIEGRTTGFVAGEYNVYPLLYPGLGSQDGENVIGFQEVKGQTGVERAFFAHHIYMTPSYNWQANYPFAYIGEVRDGVQSVIVSFPELRTLLDFRDDPIEPHRGILLSNTVQIAGGIFGGDADDVKIRPEVRTYVPVARGWTLATRVTLGFVFPRNYGQTLQGSASSDALEIQDQQLLLFRAFYSGGPNSNRGYPYRGVGPHGALLFLLPRDIECDPNDTRPICYRPLGGLTLWEASLEVRFPLLGPLRGATFVDASDVTRDVAQIRFTYPHISPGAGIRYETPVGPIRLDVGYRLPFAQKIGTTNTDLENGSPDTVAGLPIAVHFGLGEAF